MRVVLMRGRRYRRAVKALTLGDGIDWQKGTADLGVRMYVSKTDTLDELSVFREDDQEVPVAIVELRPEAATVTFLVDTPDLRAYLREYISEQGGADYPVRWPDEGGDRDERA